VTNQDSPTAPHPARGRGSPTPAAPPRLLIVGNRLSTQKAASRVTREKWKIGCLPLPSPLHPCEMKERSAHLSSATCLRNLPHVYMFVGRRTLMWLEKMLAACAITWPKAPISFYFLFPCNLNAHFILFGQFIITIWAHLNHLMWFRVR
jgi:hypothetical protein